MLGCRVRGSRGPRCSGRGTGRGFSTDHGRAGAAQRRTGSGLAGTVADKCAGDISGEFDVVRGVSRSLTAVALTSVTGVVVSAARFREILLRHSAYTLSYWRERWRGRAIRA